MATEILYKEELQPILNTVIGVNPKPLPAVLNKGDIVKYGNYLYKYKGVNGVRKELVDESSFKKVGLRYRENGYKVYIVDSMESLYKWMFQAGLNGDNQGRNWGSRKDYNVRYWFKVVDAVKLFEVDGSGFDTVEGKLIQLTHRLKDIFKENDISNLIEFPMKLGNYTITLDNLSKYEYTYFKFKDLKKIKLKPDVIKNKMREEYDKIYEFIKNPNTTIDPTEFVFFKFYNNPNLPTYEINYLHRENKDIKWFRKKYSETSVVEWGVYSFVNLWQANFDSNGELGLYFGDTSEPGDDREFTLFFENNIIKESGVSRVRFWLPYFNDMEGSDYSGISARILNRDFNKYGVYFKLDEDGTYVYRFKSIFTDRNQHEEWGTKGPWGARYAYYLRATDVRGDGDTYCRWQPKEIETELNFTIENGNIINVSLNFSEETRDTNRFKDEFVNTGYTFENGYLYIKVFYAIWSYDDNGDWNEWQFAHIIPPFSLEFKGENEFESKPIFKPPVDEWED